VVGERGFMQVAETQYTGRKAKVGRICFNDDKLRVFAGYCPDCNGKIVMTLDEAKHFANSYASEIESHSVKKLLKARIKFVV
jgi:hypothetical protein